MREIKFRAWDKSKGRYFETKDESVSWHMPTTMGVGQKINNRCNDYITFFDTANNFVFEQFTGLFDKQGVEIYEGDIVKSQDDEGNYATYKDVVHAVEFDTGSFYPVSEKWSEYFEVIGNIHENKELLKGVKNG